MSKDNMHAGVLTTSDGHPGWFENHPRADRLCRRVMSIFVEPCHIKGRTDNRLGFFLTKSEQSFVKIFRRDFPWHGKHGKHGRTNTTDQSTTIGAITEGMWAHFIIHPMIFLVPDTRRIARPRSPGTNPGRERARLSH